MSRMVDTILDFGAANSLQTLFYQIISQTLQLTEQSKARHGTKLCKDSHKRSAQTETKQMTAPIASFSPYAIWKDNRSRN